MYYRKPDTYMYIHVYMCVHVRKKEKKGVYTYMHVLGYTVRVLYVLCHMHFVMCRRVCQT